MIINTKLTDEEIKKIKDQYDTYKGIKENFPNYVKAGEIAEAMRLLEELFGKEIFS